ncbi:MAG: efflux RND transporter periplasmic adaptor subunit [Verrucomicrobia bacterium]|nr:efflux RND transporter periplasmic adaptor subunit [Verrucomicrobiota bacterium]
MSDALFSWRGRLSVVACVVFLWCAATPCVLAAVEGLVVPFRRVSVSSPVQGLIAEIHVQEGDRVDQGTLLARLQDEEERLELQRLMLILEKREFDAAATGRLLADNLISAEEAMEKRIELEVSKLQVASAQIALARKQIASPLEGVVVVRNREPGEWVNPGEVLFEVVLMDPVFVEILVDGREGLRLSRGTEVQVSVDDVQDAVHTTAIIDFIDPRIDASSGLMKVRMLMANPGQRILPGMRAKVELNFRNAPASR